MQKSQKVVIATLCVVALAGCAKGSGAPSPARTTTTASPTTAPSDPAPSASARAALPLPFKLGGVTFDGRSRAQITSALEAAGFTAENVNAQHWCDTFRAPPRITGAGTTVVCYTDHNRWASTDLHFPTHFMSFSQHAKGPGIVALMHVLAQQYGKPDIANGDLNLGPIEVEWSSLFGGRGQIKLTRGWPDQEVVLSFRNLPNYRVANAQFQQQQAAQQQQRARNALGN